MTISASRAARAAAATAIATLALSACSLLEGEPSPSDTGIGEARGDYTVNDMRDFQPSGNGWSTSAAPTAEPASAYYGYLAEYFTDEGFDPQRCADMLTAPRLVSERDLDSDWGDDTMVYFATPSGASGAVPVEITARVFKNQGRSQEIYDEAVALTKSCSGGYEYEWLSETWYVDSVSVAEVPVDGVGEFASIIQNGVTGNLYGVSDPGNYVVYLGVRGNVLFSAVHVDPNSEAIAADFEQLFVDFVEELG